MTTEMTKGERSDLASLAKERARVAKLGVEQRKAEHLADVEAQLAARYSFNDDRWADLTKTAEAAVNAADEVVAERCREIGIPEQFRPSIGVSWYSRGENASRERRAELRRVAASTLDAAAKRAKFAIDQTKVEVLTSLTASGLRTEEAAAFLQSMPTVEELMPAIDVDTLSLQSGRS